MSVSLLTFAAAHLERVSNPAFGRRANEDATMEFAAVLSDVEATSRFNTEVQLLDDANSFGSYGWQWIVGWCKANNLDLREDLVLDLIDRWDSVAFKAEIFGLLVQSADIDDASDATIYEFPQPTLRTILRKATADPQPEEEGTETAQSLNADVRSVETTLLALIAVDHPVTIAAARLLVTHDWYGRGPLRDAILARAELLDVETSQLWLEALGLSNPELR